MNPALRMYWLKIPDKFIIKKPLAKIYLHYSGEGRDSFTLFYTPAFAGVAEINYLAKVSTV